MIVGVGIDVVAVGRFTQALERTPTLAERAFTPQERTTPRGKPRSAESLAARFAAKEAVAKALGAPGNLHWHDAEITVVEHGRPVLAVRGTVAARARELGVTRWHLSMSHDAGIASAVVIAEAGAADPASDPASDLHSGLAADPRADLPADPRSGLAADPRADLPADPRSGLAADPASDRVSDPASGPPPGAAEGGSR